MTEEKNNRRTRLSRRQFLRGSVVNAAALPLIPAIPAAVRAQSSSPDARTPQARIAGAFAQFLDRQPPAVFDGATWGMPWPRGKFREKTRFALRDGAGALVGLQSWVTAYWPDGSVKWTAHALPADVKLAEGPFEIVADRGASSAAGLKISETAEGIEIETGVIRCRIRPEGSRVIESITRAGREVVRDARLVLVSQDRAEAGTDGVVRQALFESSMDRVTVEQRGPVRAVVRIEGRHAGAEGRQWLPFTLRLYFYSGSDAVRVMHTIVFDGDESKDFIRGVGLRFGAPLSDALHDRHMRFCGEGEGLFAEAVRGLTGLRRDPGEAVRRAQIEGSATPAVESFAPAVRDRLHLIPAFGDWSLCQANADAFVVRKRTKEGHGWLDAGRGRRASGLAYLGGPSGGVAFGIRNFWQSHPAQIDVRNAASDLGEVTLWVWAPDAAPMDLRFYHDGLGQDTHAEQLQGLEITYEDYEPGFGTAQGVARTSELQLRALPATPSREKLVQLAEALRTPPVVTAVPSTLDAAGVFGRTFSLPDPSIPGAARLEERLAWLFDFYVKQQDQHSWYGFWNYGDVMHTYDADRHVWRYDVGGYAWDNSELSTDIWLWLYFLRTGRADVFRFAEAMTRHTGEVDVHHLGRFAPLGSRHNVQHWGCSAKQLRISTVLNRRYYYYLTADERVGDLMREQMEAGRALRKIQPGRKLPDAAQRPPLDPEGDFAYIGFGTDWGSLAGAWLTEWERTRDRRMRDRLAASMRTIAAQPKGFFTGSERMNLNTGAFDLSKNPKLNVSHLSAAFGLPEVCAELIELLRVPEFERAWVQYCELYNASREEQQRALGEPFGPLNLAQGHARLTAYAAYRLRNRALARRAFNELEKGGAGFPATRRFESQQIHGPAVLNPVDEASWVSTNAAAQFGLAAIECLAFAGALMQAGPSAQDG